MPALRRDAVRLPRTRGAVSEAAGQPEPAASDDGGEATERGVHLYAEVALNLPLQREFTYRLPEGMAVQIGNRVLVPFRGRTRSGVVTALRETIDFDAKRVLQISRLLDGEVALPESLLELARRMAASYGCSLGEALDATLPAAAKRSGARRIPHLELAIPPDLVEQAVAELEDKQPARARVLRAVAEYGGPVPVSHVRRQTQTSDSPWQTLVRHGTLRRLMVREDGEELVPEALEAAVRHDLNEHQQQAVDSVAQAVRAGSHRTFLLHGVTGSGKTEVYLRILEEVRAAGRTGIVLVPEISLTPQTVGRFASRFPDVAVLHSGLTDSERGRQWQRLMRGEATVAIGARSALFAPVRNLGLIVLDEEHESTFKQENTPRYHAREMAVERGDIENAVVVLGSATPSLESYGRARRGAYELLTLPQRAGSGTMPKILVQDLREEGKEARVEGVMLSRTLQVLMEERLRAKDQVILFLNRRGFAPSLLCPSCGTPVQCKHCAVSMTWHVRRGRLICHYCCDERRRPEVCDECEHVGFHELGVGTERVERAVKQLFGDRAVIARMDADTMAKRGAHERVLSAFRRREIDVLIGTQMIAKGHDFPDVTLVGVISADTGLFMPDYRAAERTFQLLHQVAGRAGRADKPGTVVFQSWSPDNEAIRCAAKGDYQGFVEQELRARKLCGYPPFCRLVRLLIEGTDQNEALAMGRKLGQPLRELADTQVLGPAPAALARVKDRWRVHLLVKCFTGDALLEVMGALDKAEARTSTRLRVVVDVDPSSML